MLCHNVVILFCGLKFLSLSDLTRVSFLKSGLAWNHIPHSSDTIYTEFFSVLNTVKKGDANMAEENFKRKLSAILSADVVG